MTLLGPWTQIVLTWVFCRRVLGSSPFICWWYMINHCWNYHDYSPSYYKNSHAMLRTDKGTKCVSTGNSDEEYNLVKWPAKCSSCCYFWIVSSFIWLLIKIYLFCFYTISLSFALVDYFHSFLKAHLIYGLCLADASLGGTFWQEFHTLQLIYTKAMPLIFPGPNRMLSEL